MMIMMMMMMMMLMIAQEVFDLFTGSLTSLQLLHPWVVALTGQRKTSLSCASGSMRAVAARLVAGNGQDEAQASASRCARRIPSAEAAANE